MKKKFFFNLLYLGISIVIFIIIFEGVLFVSSDNCVFNAAEIITRLTRQFVGFDEIEISILLILSFGTIVVLHALCISSLVCHWLFAKTINTMQTLRKNIQKFKRNLFSVIFSCVFFLPFGWFPTMIEIIILIVIGNLYQKIPLEYSKSKYSKEFTNILDHGIE